MLFKEKLVILRKSRGLTQDEFASAVGVSRQAVYKWECGQSYPEVPKLLEMKLLLGISIDELLDDSFDIPIPEKKKRRRRKITEAQKAEIEAKVASEAAPAAAAAAVAPKAEPAPVAEVKKEEVKEAPAPKKEKKEAAPKAEKAPKVEKEPETVKVDPDQNVINANGKAQDSLDNALSALERLQQRKGLFSKLFNNKKK